MSYSSGGKGHEFSAYSMPQNASRIKKNVISCQIQVLRPTNPTIFLSLSSPAGTEGGTAETDPTNPGYSTLLTTYQLQAWDRRLSPQMWLLAPHCETYWSRIRR